MQISKWANRTKFERQVYFEYKVSFDLGFSHWPRDLQKYTKIDGFDDFLTSRK